MGSFNYVLKTKNKTQLVTLVTIWFFSTVHWLQCFGLLITYVLFGNRLAISYAKTSAKLKNTFV